MKIIRIVENPNTNTVYVDKINTRTGSWTLLWDHDCGSFDEFVKWYGLSYHYHYEYRQVTW